MVAVHDRPTGDLVDVDVVVALATDIAASDAAEFRNQYPAYVADSAGETRKAINALRSVPAYRERYDSFVAAMVYGEQASFVDAMTTVTSLVGRWLGS